jgi:predicted NACHT family NTPase
MYNTMNLLIFTFTEFVKNNLTISTIIALISFLFSIWVYRKQTKKERILTKEFGAELYGKEIIQNSIKWYIEPNSSSIDPAREAEPKHIITAEINLFELIDKHLDIKFYNDGLSRHILILADSGMGKTSFLLNYYAYNQKKSNRKKHRIKLIPLGLPNTDNFIKNVEDKSNTIIFLDAFDEDTKAIENHRKRLHEIMTKCQEFKRVILTCRTQFFEKDEEIPLDTGIAKVGPRKAGEKGVYEFWKIYISPLTDTQVKKYLLKRYKLNFHKRKQALELVKKIPLLSVRPMLLAYLPDIINSGKKIIKYSFELYEIMVEKWLERETRWVSKDSLRGFSESLALYIYINREKRGSYKVSTNEIIDLKKDWNISLEKWQITGRSLLNRDAVGKYKFAHLSIMEYLYVKRFLELPIEKRPSIPWTDQMKRFCWEMILSYNNK